MRTIYYCTDNPHLEPWMRGAITVCTELGHVAGPRYRALYRLNTGQHLVALHDTAVGNHAIVAYRLTTGQPRTWGLIRD